MTLFVTALAFLAVVIRAVVGWRLGGRPWQTHRLIWPTIVLCIAVPLVFAVWPPLAQDASRVHLPTSVFTCFRVVLPCVVVSALCALAPDRADDKLASLRTLVVGFIVGIGVQVLGASMYALLFHTTFGSLRVPATAPLCLAVISSIIEEQVLRGVLQGVLQAGGMSRASRLLCIVVMNVLWALGHQQPPWNRLMITLFGLFLAYLRDRRGLPVAIAAHVALDITALCLGYRMK